MFCKWYILVNYALFTPQVGPYKLTDKALFQSHTRYCSYVSRTWQSTLNQFNFLFYV